MSTYDSSKIISWASWPEYESHGGLRLPLGMWTAGGGHGDDYGIFLFHASDTGISWFLRFCAFCVQYNSSRYLILNKYSNMTGSGILNKAALPALMQCAQNYPEEFKMLQCKFAYIHFFKPAYETAMYFGVPANLLNNPFVGGTLLSIAIRDGGQSSRVITTSGGTIKYTYQCNAIKNCTSVQLALDILYANEHRWHGSATVQRWNKDCKSLSSQCYSCNLALSLYIENPDNSYIVAFTENGCTTIYGSLLEKYLTETLNNIILNDSTYDLSTTGGRVAHAAGDENKYAGGSKSNLFGNQFLKCALGLETDANLIKRFNNTNSVTDSTHFSNRDPGLYGYTNLHDEVRPNDFLLSLGHLSILNSHKEEQELYGSVYKNVVSIIRPIAVEDKIKIAQAAYNIACNPHVGYSSAAITYMKNLSDDYGQKELSNVMNLHDPSVAKNLTPEMFDADHLTTDCATDCSHFVFAAVTCVTGRYADGYNNYVNNSTYWMSDYNRSKDFFTEDKFEFINLMDLFRSSISVYPVCSLEDVLSSLNRIPDGTLLPGDIIIERPFQKVNGVKTLRTEGWPGHTMICTGVSPSPGYTDIIFPWEYNIFGSLYFNYYGNKYKNIYAHNVLSLELNKLELKKLGYLQYPAVQTEENKFRYENAFSLTNFNKIYFYNDSKLYTILNCFYISRDKYGNKILNTIFGSRFNDYKYNYNNIFVGDNRILQVSQGSQNLDIVNPVANRSFYYKINTMPIMSDMQYCYGIVENEYLFSYRNLRLTETTLKNNLPCLKKVNEDMQGLLQLAIDRSSELEINSIAILVGFLDIIYILRTYLSSFYLRMGRYYNDSENDQVADVIYNAYLKLIFTAEEYAIKNIEKLSVDKINFSIQYIIDNSSLYSIRYENQNLIIQKVNNLLENLKTDNTINKKSKYNDYEIEFNIKTIDNEYTDDDFEKDEDQNVTEYLSKDWFNEKFCLLQISEFDADG